MNDVWLFGTVDRAPIKDMTNQKWPKYLLTLAQDKDTAKGPMKRLIQIDCGYPETLKAKMMGLAPGDQVMVKGYVESKPSSDGTKFFTGIFAREITRIGSPLNAGTPIATQSQAVDFDNVPF